MRNLGLCVLAGALLCGIAAAAEFHRIDGTVVSGEARSIDAEGVIEIKPAEGDAVKVPADEVIRVEFVKDREPDVLLDGIVVYMPGGDRVCGTLKGSSHTSIEVRSKLLGNLTLPIEKLLAVEFRRAAEQPKNVEDMRERLLVNKTQDDVSFSTNGDEMSGILVGFESDKVVLRTSMGEMLLDPERLFGLSFAARERAPQPPSLLAVARCIDGSRITGKLKASEGGKLTIGLLAGPDVEIAPRAIIDIRFKHGKLVYLSDLDPVEEVTTPFFSGDYTWPMQRDRNYDRSTIRLAGETYQKGLGTFSGMKLTYNLGGEFEKFVSLVGIDDADVNHQGDVTVRVMADDKEVFNKAGITRAAGPVKIELPLKGVNKLQLVVDFGGNMHFGDLTDWADAHLIR